MKGRYILKILLFFIDGFGIGNKNQKYNPIINANTPIFDDIFNHNLGKLFETDVKMNVSGLPQSATGQTAILTGKNASKKMGRHKSGFPGPTLINLIKKYNIYKQLERYDITSTFANAYTKSYIEKVKKNKSKASVTTHCILNSKNKFRYLNDLKNKKAIYQDFTNKILIKQNKNVPIFNSKKAANILANISLKYNFTLYEYFQTDKIGHSQNMKDAIKILENLDSFLNHLIKFLKNKVTIIITSDHGNIEDLSTNTHTKNKVPTIIIGEHSKYLAKNINKITDITPAIVSELNY